VKSNHVQMLMSLLVALAIVAAVIVVVTARLSSIPADQLERGQHSGGSSHSGGGD
jgi:hypothetical protein